MDLSETHFRQHQTPADRTIVPILRVSTQSTTATETLYIKRVENNHTDMTNRDSFFSALQSLHQFVLETDADFDQALDWILDQCNWCYVTSAEWNMFEEHYNDIVKEIA